MSDLEPRAGAPEREPDLPVETTHDVVFETLWGRVLAAWDDEKTHASLLDYALRHERLPDIAARYRQLKDDPDRGPKATKKLGAIVLAAESLLSAAKARRPQKLPWQITATAFGVSLFLLGLLVYAMMRR